MHIAKITIKTEAIMLYIFNVFMRKSFIKKRELD